MYTSGHNDHEGASVLGKILKEDFTTSDSRKALQRPQPSLLRSRANATTQGFSGCMHR